MIQKIKQEGFYCLIGYPMTKKSFNKEVFKKTLRMLWKPVHGFKINDLDENLFSFVFREGDDRDRVLDGNPWLFDKHVVIVNKVEHEISPSDINLYEGAWTMVLDLPFV
ncbi:DUF4283 domain-containing protein [Cephalotus follicularis]|uniref:DUF4283 domain-containing protein n=1 Tax=Cephalotus follicularis TaxID=3775 RepID=A0A1Q3AQ97_CEPFO|nr:DUF4283 domain-containing protein [Cephalotus follicularis]